LALRGGTGVQHAAPQLDESAKQFGNPNLTAERSLQHSAGIELTPMASLLVQVTGFCSQLDGLAAKSDRIRMSGGQMIELNYENTGEGRAYGVETMSKQELFHRFSGSIAYTLSHAERRRTSNDPYRLFDNDQTHNVVLVAAYE
jgi:outer membrane cobalamin receptor